MKSRLTLLAAISCVAASAQIQIINSNDNGAISLGKINSNFSFLASSKVARWAGNGPPGTFPLSILGDLYQDTVARVTYQCWAAVGCSGVSVNNWQLLSGSGGGISSVFGRTGPAITAQNGDYSTNLVPENTNLYFTTARAQGAISAAAPITYSSGLIGITLLGTGGTPVAATALGVAGNGVQWGPTGIVDCGSPNCGEAGANANGYYLVSRSTNAPTNAVNLGALTTGLLKMTVGGSIMTPTTAVSGTDFVGPTSGSAIQKASSGNLAAAVAADVVALFSACSGTQYLGADGACHSGGGGGASAANQLTDAAISLFSTTELRLTFPANGTNYGAPPFITNYTTLAKEVISTASVCTTQYIYWDPVGNSLKMDSSGTGSGQFLLNAGSSAVITAITNYNATGYPQYAVPLYRVRAGCTTTGQWETLTITVGYWDDRSVYNTYVLKAGSSGGLTMSYSAGVNTISIDQTQPLIAPYVKSIATSSDPGCTTTADFGKWWTNNSSSTTTVFSMCGASSSTPTWISVGIGGGGGAGTVTTTGTPASGNLAKFSGGTSITNGDLTGDVTTSGTLATAINNVNSFGAGTCGDSTHVPVLTQTAKGLITNCVPTLISGGGGGVSIGAAVGGGPSVGGILYSDASNNLAQSPGLVYVPANRQLTLGTGTGDSVIAVNSAWALSIDNGQTAKFRMLAASGDIYFQNTNSSGNINFSGYGGAAAGRVNFVAAISTFVNTTASSSTQIVLGYDGVNTSATTTNVTERAGQVQGSTKLHDWQDNSGTSLISIGPTGVLNMTSQSSFLFNGKTCVLSGSAISCT